ncbi:hypothetical protein [Ktedonobacter racemifer]|uniref:Lipoprotein n=1 Tax=Ktedonobacter racemifer DSM 44963 TaxID=485913 RepID=D6U2C0_KTERA|nr:hypothetical protein [Ktedonobacter racemifer]EFH82788.1 secreted hypothetical protein [Ktedonobacter racemifer DSM 44963]
MRLRKYTLLYSMVFVLLLFLAACGGTANSGNGSNGYTTPQSNAVTPTPTTGGDGYGYGNGSGGNSGGTSGVVIKTASATIESKAATILTDAKGMTLYYFTPDTASKVACTGGCAQSWPPLLYSGSDTPQASSKLSGQLATLDANGGKQVVYNGHPLYTYSGDSAGGQTNGQGIGGKWFVATIDLGQNKA